MISYSCWELRVVFDESTTVLLSQFQSASLNYTFDLLSRRILIKLNKSLVSTMFKQFFVSNMMHLRVNKKLHIF